jgi:hypothetical protein
VLKSVQSCGKGAAFFDLSRVRRANLSNGATFGDKFLMQRVENLVSAEARATGELIYINGLFLRRFSLQTCNSFLSIKADDASFAHTALASRAIIITRVGG